MKILDYESFNNNKIKDNFYIKEFIMDVQGKNKWDCESVISTYSNIYNNPKLISEEKVITNLNMLLNYLSLKSNKIKYNLNQINYFNKYK
jgi:hypothetical protein